MQFSLNIDEHKFIRILEHIFLKYIIFLFVLFALSATVLAEGTKQLMPSEDSYGRVEIYPDFSPFAMYNCPEDYRLNITICNAGEVIYYGFGRTYDFYQDNRTDVYFRLRGPNGAIIRGPTSIHDIGILSSYDQAVAGPGNLISPGYIAFVDTAHIAGDYYIEFDFSSTDEQRREFEFFDITVADAFGNIKPGRVWSKAWQLTVSATDIYDPYKNPFDGTLFIYSDDGIVTSVDFNGMQPLVFTVSANQSGCFNTGNPYFDRKSIVGYNNYPQYKVFLQAPDENCFPTGLLGDFTEPSYFSGCSAEDYCINITVNKAGTVEILLNLNGILGFQASTEDRLMIWAVVEGHNCIPFDGLNGLGELIQSDQDINLDITYYNGITHLPLTDVEHNQNGYKVRIIRPLTPNPIPPLFWDDSNIPFGTQPPADGCISAFGCHSFSNFYGDSCTINTWWYATQDVKDSIIFRLSLSEVDANTNTPFGENNDTTICLTDGSIQLNGAFLNAVSAYWSGGSGTFSPDNNVLNPSYTFSQSELSRASVTLYLNTIGEEYCPVISDSITVYIEQDPIVDAGPDMSVCLNSSAINLNGDIYGAYFGIWSGGDGEYSPGPYDVDALYTPTDEEIANRYITLTLTSQNQICPNDSDDVTIEITYIQVDTANTDLLCPGDGNGTIDLTISGNTGGYSNVWDNGYTSHSLSGLSGGNYCFTVTEQFGCTSEECIEIFEPEELDVVITSLDVSCNGVDKGTAFANPTGGTPGYTYEWNNGLTTPEVLNLEEGIYYVTVSDTNYCTASEAVVIDTKENPPLDFQASVTVGCQPLIVQFEELNPDSSAYTYYWHFGDQIAGIHESFEKNPVYVFENPGVFDITLTLITDEGCDTSISLEHLILVYEAPEAEFRPHPGITSIKYPIIEMLSNSSENSVDYIWDFGDGHESYIVDPIHEYDQAGVYDVSLIVYTAEGCSDTAYSVVQINELTTFYVPTAFTPDDDGANDIFIAKGTKIDNSNYMLMVFDRWGMELFRTHDLYTGWDGRSKNGKKVPTGTYTWYVKYIDGENREHIETGPVTLIR